MEVKQGGAKARALLHALEREKDVKRLLEAPGVTRESSRRAGERAQSLGSSGTKSLIIIHAEKKKKKMKKKNKKIYIKKKGKKKKIPKARIELAIPVMLVYCLLHIFDKFHKLG
jgi:hypothetical protein